MPARRGLITIQPQIQQIYGLRSGMRKIVPKSSYRHGCRHRAPWTVTSKSSALFRYFGYLQSFTSMCPDSDITHKDVGNADIAGANICPCQNDDVPQTLVYKGEYATREREKSFYRCASVQSVAYRHALKLGLFNKFRFKFHCTNTVDFAINIMITVDQTNDLDFSADFDNR